MPSCLYVRNLNVPQVVLGLALALVVATLLPLSAQAHGGGDARLANEAAGPYLVTTWIDPAEPRVGELHLTVAVSEPSAGGEGVAGLPVLGADVLVQLNPVSADADPIEVVASHEQAENRLFYEADVTVPAAGTWLVSVHVDGPLGTGDADFPIEVGAAAGINWPLAIMVAGALLLALFILLHLFRRYRPAVGAAEA
ncbi:MAG: hypothetical protein R3272_02785 [Candidatus Promineifilaceae bacterium]|nr:hypothetical protein [Candidatus Promineifilaceae bacterium]